MSIKSARGLAGAGNQFNPYANALQQAAAQQDYDRLIAMRIQMMQDAVSSQLSPYRAFVPMEMVEETKPPLKASTAFGEIEAWRAWRVKCGYLRSAYKETLWMPGQVMSGEGVGDHNQVGIHGWPDKAGAVAYGMEYANHRETHSEWIAIGRVHLWGTVIKHEKGYRAEFGRVIALDDLFHSSEHHNAELLTMLRQKYSVAP